MECTFEELFFFFGFFLSIIVANFASWKMEKNITAPLEEISKWKLLLGDIALPKDVLTPDGKRWRIASIISFCILVAFGIIFAVVNNRNGSCFT